MKFSIISVLSVAACLLSSFVAASPAASSLAVRDSTSDALITIVLGIKVDLDTCHTKWKNTCATTCSQTQVSSWAKECADIITKGANKCKSTIPPGWKFPDSKQCISILAEIIITINTVLNFLLGKCGLLGGLIAVLLGLVTLLIGDLTVALKLLLSCLGVAIDDLLTLVTVAVGALLGGVLCVVCNLLGLLGL